MNEAIKKARDVGLGILQPSQKDLEHGMELHKESVVVESYGLGLSAPIDGDVVAKAIEDGATEVELQDLTGDQRMTRWATVPELSQEFSEAWEASGVTCTFQNAGEEGNDPRVLIQRLARHTYVTDMMPDLMHRATRPEDIEAAKLAGKHCRYMTGNGIPLAKDQRTVEEEMRFIRVFFQLGIRMMHLTYNRRNVIGDGCAEPADAGLSDFGHAVIGEMNRVGVIVDVAHTGRQTSLDAAAVAERPMVVSHSCAHALRAHVRCKDDEVIRAIIATGGTMGITNVPAFLGDKGDISSMLDHIDFVAKAYGVDHVTIGTDGAYSSIHSQEENRKLPTSRALRSRWEALWPENDPVRSGEWKQDHQMQSLCWTNWSLYTVGLVQRGYSDADIRKIIGGNILRVAKDVLA
jgi:membrane dipeptidase